MKYFHLVWGALFRRKTRTVFTLLSVLAAFLLFGLLDSVRSAFANAGNSVAGVDRLITISKVSFTVPLPKSLLPRIQAVPGVARVSYANWFGGIYQDPKNFFPNEAVADNFLDLYPEWVMSDAERSAFKQTRTGAVVGESLARKFNWKLGDKIPLQATIFPQKDGSNTWTFDIVGIFHTKDPKLQGQENVLFFNWDYFNETNRFTGGGSNVGWYTTKMSDRNQADRVAQAIDKLSADSDHETKTQSEQAFTAALVSQFADIGLIVGAIMGAVFFTLVLLTGNTMAQAVRERIPELAVLKTIGFSNKSVLSLVLSESRAVAPDRGCHRPGGGRRGGRHRGCRWRRSTGRSGRAAPGTHGLYRGSSSACCRRCGACACASSMHCRGGDLTWPVYSASWVTGLVMGHCCHRACRVADRDAVVAVAGVHSSAGRVDGVYPHRASIVVGHEGGYCHHSATPRLVVCRGCRHRWRRRSSRRATGHGRGILRQPCKRPVRTIR